MQENSPEACRLNLSDVEPADFTTPNLRPEAIVYEADLAKSGNTLRIPLMNVVCRLQYNTSTSSRLYLEPADSAKPVMIDAKRAVQWNSSIEGERLDNHKLSSAENFDTTIYNQSNEIHSVFIRQQDPVTGLWSLCRVDTFFSEQGARVTSRVEWIEANVLYV